MGKQVICEHNITPKNRCRDCQRAANRRSAAKHVTPTTRHEKYLANKTQHLVWAHNSKAKRLGVPGTLIVEDYERVKSQPCIYCGYSKFIEIDHIIPFAKGGTNWPENVQACCRYCNSAKHFHGEEDFLEWLNRLRGSLVTV